ncbi:MAG TPA: polysaccharide biosynthesis protein [Allosphingosinicella sp.]|nr:polysaccharide biosynthesis protein [Allosphingosinicella sp.]
MARERATEGAVTRGDVAKGAGLAGLARAGAVIEAVAQALYTWLFGLATYGIYVVLWAAVNLLSNFVDLAMTIALQRVVPAEDDERAHAAVKAAMLIGVVPATLVALVASLEADRIAPLLNVAAADRADLPLAIALFAWALPLWTFVEISTSAARARRAFGPEIRLRIFWEQVVRILFALAFWALSFASLGLIAAHLCSLAITAFLSARLLGRFYDLKLLVRAPIGRGLFGTMFRTGLALLPSNLARRLLIDAPPLFINLLLPGARGAEAAGLFEIARKISTVPAIVRQSFQYVLGPLTSEQARLDRSAIGPLYRFATRISAALVLPLGGLLIFAGADILSIYRPGVAAALPILWILVAARVIEAIVGPASTIVEMIGHRLLPLVNSLAGVGLWAGLAAFLVPRYGAIGMALSVGAGTLASSYAATIELRISDGLTPFDRKSFQALAIAAAGVLLMAAVEWVSGGPVRFVSVTLLWAATTWLAMRYGLTREDRDALGGFSRRLGLVRGAGRA